MARVGPITELHQEYGLFEELVLTKTSTLIGAVAVEGRDPDGLNEHDFQGLSLIARSLIQRLPHTVASLTQYYMHFESAKVRLSHRKDPVSDYLSRRREGFLNEKGLTRTRIVFFIEVAPRENLTELSVLAFIKHAALAVKSRESRAIIGRMFSAEKTVVCLLSELKHQSQTLKSVAADLTRTLGGIFTVRPLPARETWAAMRAIANLEPELLDTGLAESVPKERWDIFLSEGDRCPVRLPELDALKLCGVVNTYAQILSLTRFSEKRVAAGMWAAGRTAPIRQNGNFIIMLRFMPMGRFETAFMFDRKRRELEQKNINIVDLVTGRGESLTARERRELMKPAIREQLAELEEAEAIEDRWYFACGQVVSFDQSTARLRETSEALKNSLNQSGLSLCVENVDLPDAWKTFLPAGRPHGLRKSPLNATQLGALSLIYKSTEGQSVIEDLGGEEAQYVFCSENGAPFHFSPFVGGRAVVIGVGPIRSGKSFTKNTLACHWLKYGGFFRAIDIDPGSEPVAQSFGQAGAVFRFEENQGFNPFAAARGPDDVHFMAHLKNVVLRMIASNENESLRSLDAHEQRQLDEAIAATLRLPLDLQNFGTMIRHCPQELQEKLYRWHGEGMYARLFDQRHDPMETLSQRVVAFNLASIKDDPVSLPLVMSEIFYRVTRAFEDPKFRVAPKWLDVDEAHALLRTPYICEYITRGVRTWGKWLAGIGLWTQGAQEFAKIADWPVLRSAASTFFFMADPTMDRGLYKAVFELTDGECDEIRGLVPQREAYIVQREIGISKKIILEVEPEQYVISTSKPIEAEARRRNINLYGFKAGVEKTVEELRLNATHDTYEVAV